MGDNAIQGVTGEYLQHLQTLSILELRDNRISKLPDDIAMLQQLQRLDISNNNISQ